MHMWVIYQLNIALILLFIIQFLNFFFFFKKGESHQLYECQEATKTNGTLEMPLVRACTCGLHRNQQWARYFTFCSLCPCNSTISRKIKVQIILITIFDLKMQIFFKLFSVCKIHAGTKQCCLPLSMHLWRKCQLLRTIKWQPAWQ